LPQPGIEELEVFVIGVAVDGELRYVGDGAVNFCRGVLKGFI
jgi:hypothetical protein